MTLQDLPPQPLPVRPSKAQLWAQLDEADQTDVLKRIGKRGAEVFEQKFEAVKKALGLRPQPAPRRLAYYYRKTLLQWEEQRAKYPRSFAFQQRDFQKLREREAAGELVAEAV